MDDVGSMTPFASILSCSPRSPCSCTAGESLRKSCACTAASPPLGHADACSRTARQLRHARVAVRKSRTGSCAKTMHSGSTAQRVAGECMAGCCSLGRPLSATAMPHARSGTRAVSAAVRVVKLSLPQLNASSGAIACVNTSVEMPPLRCAYCRARSPS